MRVWGRGWGGDGCVAAAPARFLPRGSTAPAFARLIARGVAARLSRSPGPPSRRFVHRPAGWSVAESLQYSPHFVCRRCCFVCRLYYALSSAAYYAPVPPPLTHPHPPPPTPAAKLTSVPVSKVKLSGEKGPLGKNLNEAVWSQGIKHVPFTMRLRLSRQRNQSEEGGMECVVSVLGMGKAIAGRKTSKGDEEA